MPCPYFYPVDQLVWASAPKLPLGDAYTGSCRADPVQPAPPAADALVDLCNLGYARGRCARFPEGAGPDAVRFAVTQDAAGAIRISWVRESDHHPFDHGVLEYTAEAQALVSAPVDGLVLQQAQAYLASYLRRKKKVRRES